MGVMRCSRSGCEGVLHLRALLSKYICADCLGELKQAKRDWPMRMTQRDLESLIEQFFESEPRGKVVDTDAEFERMLGKESENG